MITSLASQIYIYIYIYMITSLLTKDIFLNKNSLVGTQVSNYQNINKGKYLSPKKKKKEGKMFSEFQIS